MKFTGEFFVPDEKLKNLEEDRELAIEHLQRYTAVLSLVTGKDVLDIASGEGYGSRMLSEVASKVTGVDISRELIGYSSSKYKKENLEFIEGNVTNIPMDDASVDVIISFETLEHVGEVDQEKFIKEASRVLRQDGVLIISTPDKKNYSDRFGFTNTFHINELDELSFISLLRSEFESVELYQQGQEVVSLILNREHYHKSNLIQILPVTENHFRLEGKYLLAVCSKCSKKVEYNLSGVTAEGNKSFFDLTGRIVQLQKEVEELGAWGRRSSAELEQLRIKFGEQGKALQTKETIIKQYEILVQSWETAKKENERLIQEKNIMIRQFEGIINHKEKVHYTNEITYQENKNYIEQLQQQTLKQKNIIEQLRTDKLTMDTRLRQSQKVLSDIIEKNTTDVKKISDKLSNVSKELEEQRNAYSRIENQKNSFEQKLQLIYESEGWKLLSLYYKIKGRLLPENSGRYKALKKLFQYLKAGKRKISRSAITVVKVEPHIEKDYKNLVHQSFDDISFPVSFTEFDDIDVSIVIPAFNNWEFTKNCLLSIYKYNDGIPFEIIIGDNVSTDETQRLPDYFKNINYIRNPENLGYIKNVNNAASKARGKYILTLNNDTTVTEGWLKNLIAVMESDPKAGLVGSKLVYPDGSLQEAGGIVWKDASGWNYGRTSDPDLPEYNYLKEVDYVSGASNLIRRGLWEKLNGLDLRYVPAYFDDSDLAFGIRSLGYKVIYQPLSVVVHYEGLTHGNNTSEGIKQYQVTNKSKFIDKWKRELEAEQFPNGEKVFWARDRSRDKKTILVIDHYVPHFDKDAGSRTVFQYLKLFISLNLNVKFIGDNFYRHEPYTTILQQMGIEVLYGPYYYNNWQKWIKDNHDKFDFVLLNRPHITIKYIDFIEENTRAKILYYGHDLHFLRELKQYEVEKDQALLESSQKWKTTETYIFNKSNVVLAPSEEEKQIINKLTSTDKAIAIRPYIFEKADNAISDFESRKNILFVGGFTHIPNVDAVLWFVEKVWPLVRTKIPDARFIIAGSNAPKEIEQLSSKNIRVTGYLTDEELDREYSQARVIVVPLRYGAGVKGKTVEAMKKGIPLITTSFGIEGLPGDYSFLSIADTEQTFAEKLVSVYCDSNLLVQLSNKNVEYIQSNFTEGIAKGIIKEVLK